MAERWEPPGGESGAPQDEPGEHGVPHSSAHGSRADIREQWGLWLRKVPSTAGDNTAAQVFGGGRTGQACKSFCQEKEVWIFKQIFF